MPTTHLAARRPDAAAIDAAAAILRRGGLVALPTETVYGLGANALDPDAVRRIFTVKGRPPDNPLIVHLASAADLRPELVELTPLARELAARFWPGPLTLVVRAGPAVPRITTGGLDTVAVRVPDHPVAAAVIAAAGVPVAAPSANRSTRPSPTTAAHVLDDLGRDVDLVLDGGPCPIGVESTVVDVRGMRPVVLRAGSVTHAQLGTTPAAAVATAGDTGTADEPAASPGTRYRHYAPRCRVEVLDAAILPRRAAALAPTARVGVVTSAPAPPGTVPIARFRDAADLAQQLYRTLRGAEDAEVDVLLVETVPEHGVGRAVMDRLRRAAAG